MITPAQCGPTPPERNDTIPTAVPTGLSSAAPGTYIACGVIGDNNYHALDVDMFRVQVNAGDVLQVDIDAAAFGSPLDSILRIFNATGHPMISSLERGDTWGWCYVHRRYFDPMPGKLPRRRSGIKTFLGRLVGR